MGALTEAPTTALFGKTRRALLGVLYGHPDEEFHLRDLVRVIGGGQGAVHRELRQLQQAGLVERRELGRLALYRANPASPIYPELRALILKTVGASALLARALAPLTDRIAVAFIYGSVARGTETASSDVDLMLIADLTLDEVVPLLLEVQNDLGREVNPTIVTVGEWQRLLRAQDGFARRVMEAPKLFVMGDADDLGRLGTAGLADRTDAEPPRDRRTP